MFPPMCGKKGGRRPLDVINQQKITAKRKLCLDCAALYRGGRKTFFKSLLFLVLIFQNSELKCFSTINLL